MGAGWCHRKPETNQLSMGQTEEPKRNKMIISTRNANSSKCLDGCQKVVEHYGRTNGSRMLAPLCTQSSEHRNTTERYLRLFLNRSLEVKVHVCFISGVALFQLYIEHC